MKKNTWIKIGALSLAILASASQAEIGTTPSVQEQMNGLADLIGSAAFLRDHCGVTDIPANKSLSMIAIVTAMDMGWDSREYYPNGESTGMYNAKLDQMGQKVEQSITVDGTDASSTCQSLAANQHIAAFVALAKARG